MRLSPVVVQSPYFVLTLCGLCFTTFFTAICGFMLLTKRLEWREVKQLVGSPRMHFLSALVGIFDASNGILIVFSSIASRTPAPLQSLLVNTSIPFTVLLSRVILGTRPTKSRMLGVILAVGGVVISLVPLFVRMHQGKETDTVQHWYWPVLFIAGVIPGAAMNVIQARVNVEYQTKFGAHMSVFVFQVRRVVQVAGGRARSASIAHVCASRHARKTWTKPVPPPPVSDPLQALESLYQTIFFVLCFWVNFVPGFGIFTFHTWSESMSAGFKCFFNSSMHDHCLDMGLLGAWQPAQPAQPLSPPPPLTTVCCRLLPWARFAGVCCALAVRLCA